MISQYILLCSNSNICSFQHQNNPKKKNKCLRCSTHSIRSTIQSNWQGLNQLITAACAPNWVKWNMLELLQCVCSLINRATLLPACRLQSSLVAQSVCVCVRMHVGERGVQKPNSRRCLTILKTWGLTSPPEPPFFPLAIIRAVWEKERLLTSEHFKENWGSKFIFYQLKKTTAITMVAAKSTPVSVNNGQVYIILVTS